MGLSFQTSGPTLYISSLGVFRVFASIFTNNRNSSRENQNQNQNRWFRMSRSSLIPRSRINNAVEGAGGAATAATAAAAAAAALAAVDEWKENDLKRDLAKQLWESPLMNDYRDALNRMLDAALRQSEALKDLKSTLLTLAGMSIVNFMLWIAFLRPRALEGIFSWTRLAKAACIAAMVLFSFL